MKEYYQYWGKAIKAENDNTGESGYHLLIYHLLDVAAVGQVSFQHLFKIFALIC